jgi:DNA-directed RNA polymerase subunit M/transcription elongation factor TFIIS
MSQIIRCVNCSANLGIVQKDKVKIRNGDKFDKQKLTPTNKAQAGCPKCGQVNYIF